jgi:hypothetical protein
MNVYLDDSLKSQLVKLPVALLLIWAAFGVAGGLVGIALILGAVTGAEIVRLVRRRGKVA